jgi:hypothetical protein
MSVLARKPGFRALLTVGVLMGVVFIAVPGGQVFAADIHPYNLPEVTADNSTLKTVFQIIFGIIGAFAVLSITASGFKYITAAGDPQRTSEAKKGIAYALVGLAIAISAEAIVTFLISYGS